MHVFFFMEILLKIDNNLYHFSGSIVVFKVSIGFMEPFDPFLEENREPRAEHIELNDLHLPAVIPLEDSKPLQSKISSIFPRLRISNWRRKYPKEYEFQRKLKKQCIPHPHLKGKLVEREDAETSDIFKTFGCYYFHEVAQDKLSSGDMPGYRLSILRAVGLLCAAKVRETDDDNIADIDDIIASVWKSIRAIANPNDPAVDQCENKKFLMELLASVKGRVQNIRTQTADLESDFVNDDFVHTTMFYTSDQFKTLFIDIYQKCMSLIGSPPCEFDLMGLGSLARREFTAYSDFESAILLENPSEETTEEELEMWKNYFRSVALLFDIVLLNIGETMIPALNIPAFNDKLNNNDWFFDIRTPTGISIDGLIPSSCINPLGRMEPTLKKSHLTEFIKPVDEMLKYLDDDEVLLNGYHVSQVLMCSTSLHNENFGNENLYKEFQKKLSARLHLKRQKFPKEDLKYCQKLCETQGNSTKYLRLTSNVPVVNVKHGVYRYPTLTIMSIGKRHGIYNKSSLEIFDQLYQDGLIKEDQHKRFVHFIALVNELRLKLYSSRKKHDDLIPHNSVQKNVKAFGDVMDDDKVVDLFTILYEIQCFACDKKFTEKKKRSIEKRVRNHLNSSCFYIICALFCPYFPTMVLICLILIYGDKYEVKMRIIIIAILGYIIISLTYYVKFHDYFVDLTPVKVICIQLGMFLCYFIYVILFNYFML